MKSNDIGTQLLYSTCPVRAITPNGEAYGTGFFYNYASADGATIPLLLTNKHVVGGAERVEVAFVLGENDGPSKERAVVAFEDGTAEKYCLGDYDLVAIPFAPVLGAYQDMNQEIFYKAVDAGIIPSKVVLDELSAIEEITYIGYPSGMVDSFTLLPIVRRGITATPIWSDYQGEPLFLIDGSVFPGSSGSPVFIFNQGAYATSSGITIGNRLMFVGVISQTVLQASGGSLGRDYLNLGVVINSRVIKEELDLLVRKLVAND